MMIVGEQPGDQEDIEGGPFVGPAGRVLDSALRAAQIDRQASFVTNAVKHFKFENRGKRRLHKKPSAGEIDQCRWWLDQEIALVEPEMIVVLGASAARGVLGCSVRISDVRSRVIASPAGIPAVVTVHPSFLLRIPDEERRLAEERRFVDDLSLAASHLADKTRARSP
jgi:DNA polymerase